MPIYAYECDECGVRFDARQKFSDAPIAVCPECGGHTHRVPQPVGIVFKGSGWYGKDSRGKNNLAVPPKKDGDSEGSAKSETKSETESTGSAKNGADNKSAAD